MFIKARPEEYVSGYYLINTDCISYAWNCMLTRSKENKGKTGLLVKFGDEKVVFKNMSLSKLEDLLARNDRDAIVSALVEDEEPTTDWSPGPGPLQPIETGNNFGENTR